MLFATGTLARRIEQAESTLIAHFGGAARRRLGADHVIIKALGGGTAVVAGPGSPFSKVAGLGFERLDDAGLASVEREFALKGTPVRIELTTLADPTVGAALTRRGYVLSGFENVLGLSLDPARPRPSAGPITITRISAADSGRWKQVVGTGFLHPDTFDGPAPVDVLDGAAIDQAFEDMSEVEELVQYLATVDGRAAGGASMRMSNGVAQLCGAATLPEYRRRGVQTTLLRERLADAARDGCDVAIVTTEPGSRSQENAQRQGFSLLYARAILIRAVERAA